MTICIATICEANSGNPKIVFTSDRQATDQDGYTFELGVPKIVAITGNCLVMQAGDSFRGDRIIERFGQRIADITPEEYANMKIGKAVEILSEEYAKVLEEAIETEIFRPRGLTRKYFYDSFKQFPEWFALIIDNEVRSFDLSVKFIVMGIELNITTNIPSAQVYTISDKGEPQNLTSIGFAMAGIGEKMSLHEYTRGKYSPNNSLDDAIVRTYWAKRSAERMLGVGSTTDFGHMFLEYDQNATKIICKNVLWNAELVKKLLDDEFEKSRKEVDNMTDVVRTHIKEFIKGERRVALAK